MRSFVVHKARSDGWDCCRLYMQSLSLKVKFPIFFLHVLLYFVGGCTGLLLQSILSAVFSVTSKCVCLTSKVSFSWSCTGKSRDNHTGKGTSGTLTYKLTGLTFSELADTSVALLSPFLAIFNFLIMSSRKVGVFHKSIGSRAVPCIADCGRNI